MDFLVQTRPSMAEISNSNLVKCHTKYGKILT